jgi:hypothetical protein
VSQLAPVVWLASQQIRIMWLTARLSMKVADQTPSN